MSKAAKTLRSLKPGDIVKYARTAKYVGPDPLFPESHLFEDVSGPKFPRRRLREDTGSLQIEMVKRVSRRKPQRQDFKPGDIITGKQLKDVWWKRGTILSHTFDNQSRWVLHADARWHSVDNDFTYSFDEFGDVYKYKIVYLP